MLDALSQTCKWHRRLEGDMQFCEQWGLVPYEHVLRLNCYVDSVMPIKDCTDEIFIGLLWN